MRPISRTLKRALATFLAIATLVSIATQLASLSAQVRTIATFALVLAVLALALQASVEQLRWRFRAARTLPTIQRVKNLCTGYQVMPATAEDIAWTARLEERVYSKPDAVRYSVLKEWYDANPKGFFIIRTRDGQPVGQLNFLAIKPATMASFISGEIKESGIRGDSLYAATDRALVRDLYVESIAMDRRPRQTNDPALVTLLANSLLLMNQIADINKLERVFAIAASHSGQRILRDLGFNEIKSADDRANHHSMFDINVKTLIGNLRDTCGAWLREPEGADEPPAP